MCDKHYRRWQRHGDTETRLRARDSGSEFERWYQKISIEADGCWHWTAGRDGQGYGDFHSTQTSKAHRFAYLTLVGPIPDGMELDHLCRVRHCVNPSHLEPVTHAENVRRGEAGINHSSKSQCKHGHEFTPENTYTPPRGGRSCRECTRRKVREHMRRKRSSYTYTQS